LRFDHPVAVGQAAFAVSHRACDCDTGTLREGTFVQSRNKVFQHRFEPVLIRIPVTANCVCAHNSSVAKRYAGVGASDIGYKETAGRLICHKVQVSELGPPESGHGIMVDF
jgi:hypothetical protein